MKKKMKAGLIVVVTIAAVMMLSSYASAQSPDEIMASALNNSEEVTSYKYDMNMTIGAITGNETNVTEMTIKVNGRGARDIMNESMRMAMNINVNTTDESTSDMPEAIATEMYLINNTVYMKVDLGIPMPWIKMEQPVANETYNETYNESYLPSLNQLELLQMMVQNCTNVTLLDEAVVDSTECYVLKLELDFKKLLEFLMGQIAMGELDIPGFDNQDLMDDSQETEIGNVTDDMGNVTDEIGNVTDAIEDTIDMMNMSVTEWMAKDTYLVMKAEATLDMTTTSPDTEEETTIAIDFNVRLYDYNVPVKIVLPPEAEAAMDISDLLDMLPEGTENDILPGGNETGGPR